jgi:tetratricopeptide (TPR) repeat protein
MKKLLFIFFLTLNMGSINAQTYKELIQKADSCYRAKDYKLSVGYYEKAFKIEHKKASDLYNGACSAALLKEEKKAFEWLNLAIDNDYDNITHLKNDGDLESLHNKKEWEKTIAKLQKKLDIIEADYDKPLQKELLEIYADDQGIRKDFMKVFKEKGSGNKSVDSIGKIMIYKDSLNLIKVSKIIDEKGWVSKAVVGSQANQTLFLVLQHGNLKSQQKYLPIMREAVKKGNANPSSLALLEDRVALREGRKQIYGSQISTNSITKKSFVSPLEDPDNVDKRRAEVGLGPLADYIKNWGLTWDVEAYKKELPELEKIEKQRNKNSPRI